LQSNNFLFVFITIVVAAVPLSDACGKNIEHLAIVKNKTCADLLNPATTLNASPFASGAYVNYLSYANYLLKGHKYFTDLVKDSRLNVSINVQVNEIDL
jgi:hypothetical protein